MTSLNTPTLLLFTLLPFSAQAAGPAAAAAQSYACPSGNPFNSLGNGETAQATTQPKCKTTSGSFTEQRCGEGIVTSTWYFLPLEGQEASWTGARTFFDCFDKGSSLKHTVGEDGKLALVCRPPPKSGAYDPPGCCKPMPSPGAVNVQGTGVLRDGRVIEYDGMIHANDCANLWGSPTVMSQGSKKCLVPFVTVACDTKLYPYGTIFEIPLLKDASLPLPPDGKRQLKHPGFVICEDGGSAITGKNRFDFYVGTFGDKDPLNYFSAKSSGPAQLRMDVNNCNKPFKVIPLPDKQCKAGDKSCSQKTKDWQTALKKINSVMGSYRNWFTAPGEKSAGGAAKPAGKK